MQATISALQLQLQAKEEELQKKEEELLSLRKFKQQTIENTKQQTRNKITFPYAPETNHSDDAQPTHDFEKAEVPEVNVEQQVEGRAFTPRQGQTYKSPMQVVMRRRLSVYDQMEDRYIGKSFSRTSRTSHLH